MKGPLHAIRRRRSERPANGVDTTQAAPEAPTEAQPTAGLSSPPPRAAPDQAPPTAELGPTGQPTVVQPVAGTEVPAGQEPIPDRPSFRQRGRMRRRLRYLRRVRELGFRDLGGLIFDQHRFSRVNTTLVDGKLHALVAVDGELRALEHALDDHRPLTELREPGISVCSRCGALHGSEARFCPSCGTPVRGPRAIAEVGEGVSLPGRDAAPAPATPPPPAQPAAPVRLQPQPLTPEPLAAAPPAPDPPHAAEPVAPGPGPAPADGEQAAAPHADSEQPTEVMRRADERPDTPAGNGDGEAVAQPTGEPREP
ncbi:MAG TPA: zinc-ribbon domain-containing protein [Solirubrobacteraceae bacterium]